MNGVPLRRMAQAYVIATQTKVDIDGVDLPEGLNDDYFRRSGAKNSGEGIFADSTMVSTVFSMPKVAHHIDWHCFTISQSLNLSLSLSLHS